MHFLSFVCFSLHYFYIVSFSNFVIFREEIGYDGWRLDFVRGFWGGYVKDYMDATKPYFSVGEYWDSLSYTYGEMDHNQDAHRQRIVDWISAAGGSAGAFDVTTKGILHSVSTQLMVLIISLQIYSCMVMLWANIVFHLLDDISIESGSFVGIG